jgi:hypothetical protein
MIKGKEENLLSRLKVTAVGEGGDLPGRSWVHYELTIFSVFFPL